MVGIVGVLQADRYPDLVVHPRGRFEVVERLGRGGELALVGLLALDPEHERVELCVVAGEEPRLARRAAATEAGPELDHLRRLLRTLALRLGRLLGRSGCRPLWAFGTTDPSPRL